MSDGPSSTPSPNPSPSAGQDSIVLEEEIDPNYVPTEAEVVDYAQWMGMDLEADKDLFWIAREGLMAPLPANWKPCKTKDTEDIYYFNFATGESTWDHPCDGYYKRLYEEEKKKKEIKLKEKSDEFRSKAKQDVAEIIGKKEKKKKPQAKLESSLELKPADSPLPLTGLRKPLPELRKPPLSNSLATSADSLPSTSSSLLSADAKSETSRSMPSLSSMAKPTSLSALGSSSLFHNEYSSNPVVGAAAAKGPHLEDDNLMEKPIPHAGSSLADRSPAPAKDSIHSHVALGGTEQKQEKPLSEDKALAPLSGRGLSPMRALPSPSTRGLGTNLNSATNSERYSTPTPMDVPNNHINNDGVNDTAARQQISILQQHNQVLQEQVQQLEGERSRLMEVISSKDINLTEIRGSTFKIESELQSIKQEKQLLQMEKNNLLAMNQQLQNSMLNNPFEQQTKELQLKLTEKTSETIQLRGDLSRKDSEIQSLTAQYSMLKDENTRLASNNNAAMLTNSNSRSSDVHSAYEVQIKELLQKATEQTAQIVSLREELGKKENELQSMISVQTMLKEENKQLLARDTTSQAQQNAFDTKSQHNGMIETLELQIKELNTKLFAKEQLEAQQRILTSNQSIELADLQNRSQSWITERRSLQQQIGEQQEQLHALNKEKISLEQQLRDIQRSRSADSIELNQPSVPTIDEELQILRAEQLNLNTQLANTTKELQETKYKYDLLVGNHNALKDLSNQKDKEMEDVRTQLITKNKELHLTLQDKDGEVFSLKMELQKKCMAYEEICHNMEILQKKVKSLEEGAGANSLAANEELRVEQLTSQLANTTKELQETKYKYDLLVGNHNALKDLSNQKDKEMEDVRTQLITKNKELHLTLQDKDGEVFSLKMELQKKCMAYEEICHNMEILQKKVKSLEEESTRSANSAGVNSSAIHDELQAARLEQSNLSSQLANTSRELQEVKYKYDLLVGNHNALKDLSNQKDKEMEDIRTQLITKNKELHLTLQDKDGEVFSLKMELQKKCMAYEEICHNMEILQKKVKSLEEELVTKEKLLNDLRVQLQSKQKELLDSQLQLEEVSLQHKQLQLQASKAVKDREESNTEQQQKENNVILSYKNQLSSQQEIIQDLTNRMSSLLSEKNQLAEKLFKTEQLIQKLENTLNMKIEELNEITLRSQGYDKKVRGYQEEILQLQKLLQSSKDNTTNATISGSSGSGSGVPLTTNPISSIVDSTATAAGTILSNSTLERRLEDVVVNTISRIMQQSNPSIRSTNTTTTTTTTTPSDQNMDNLIGLDDMVKPKGEQQQQQSVVDSQSLGYLVTNFSKYTQNFTNWSHSACSDMNKLIDHHALSRGSSSSVSNSVSSSGSGSNGLTEILQSSLFRKEQEIFYSKLLTEFLTQCKDVIHIQRSQIKTMKASPKGNDNNNKAVIVDKVNMMIAMLNDTIRSIKGLQQLTDDRDRLVQRLSDSLSQFQLSTSSSTTTTGGYFYQINPLLHKVTHEVIEMTRLLHENLNSISQILTKMEVCVTGGSNGDDIPLESYCQDQQVYHHPSHHHHTAAAATVFPSYPWYSQQQQQPHTTTSYTPPISFLPPPPPLSSATIPSSSLLTQPPSHNNNTITTTSISNIKNQLNHHSQLGQKQQLDLVQKQIQEICERRDSSKQAYDRYFKGLTSIAEELHGFPLKQKSTTSNKHKHHHRSSGSSSSSSSNINWLLLSAQQEKETPKINKDGGYQNKMKDDQENVFHI